MCVRYVDPETDGKHLTGYSWSEAFATIDDALDSVEKSGESCEIWVREGIYDEELHLRGKVALYGGFSGDEQSLSERDPEANPVVLTRPVWGGGAVDSVAFRSVVLSSGSALTVRRAKFLGDDTQLSADEEETLVEDSVFDDMSTGVIYSDGGDITVRRCRISGSSGTIAVNTSPATIRFEDSFIVDNETSTALFSVYRGKLVLQNTVVAGNVTAYSGADLFSAASATVEIVNSTIVDNVSQAGLDPGPTFYVATANLRVFNTIVWGNGRDLLNGPYGDVVVEHSVIEGGYEGSGNLSTAPTFLDSDAHPYRLAPGSIGIDAGTSVGAPELDLVGDARFDDPEVSNTGAGDTTYVDIGAYEAH